MKFHRTPQFNHDYRALHDVKLQNEVKRAFPELKKAFMGDTTMRSKYCLHPLLGWPSIYAGHLKYNLCFTYHYEQTTDEEQIIFFRRIGTHTIYNSP